MRRRGTPSGSTTSTTRRGHVLGAAMFQVRVGSESLVYTGDYNMTPDRHLGAAWIGTIHILRKHLYSAKVNFLKNWVFSSKFVKKFFFNITF